MPTLHLSVDIYLSFLKSFKLKLNQKAKPTPVPIFVISLEPKPPNSYSVNFVQPKTIRIDYEPPKFYVPLSKFQICITIVKLLSVALFRIEVLSQSIQVQVFKVTKSADSEFMENFAFVKVVITPNMLPVKSDIPKPEQIIKNKSK